jgi:hypothetical protein
MKVGDKVTLIAIPSDIQDDDQLQTRTLFEKCLGEIFTVAALQTVDGLAHQLVQLDVGRVLGKAAYLETIWVEPAYLQTKNSE